MTSHQKTDSNEMEKEKFPAGDTGNASNPSSPNPGHETENNSQLLDGKAEKYLREVASIEDVPDDQDQQEMDEIYKEEKENR